METGQSTERDRKLVDDFLARRDEGCFRALYRAHTPALFRTAYRLLDSDQRDEVEDVVQETWIRAAARLAGFEWRSQLRTWLVGILVNCLREFRRRHHRELTTSVEIPVEVETPDHGAGFDLETAIAHLPARARAVLALHDIEGFTHEEIGELLEISAGTSKSQLFEARRKLRKRLGGRT